VSLIFIPQPLVSDCPRATLPQTEIFYVAAFWPWVRCEWNRPKYTDQRSRQQAVINGIVNQVQHRGKTNVMTQISIFQA